MKEQINTPTRTTTQTNSAVCELDRIEEMAECCPYFWNGECTVDAANPTDCDLMCEMFGFMTSLLHAGYRKQSEVAREIFEEIERAIKNYGICFSCAPIAELKKKYTEDQT